MANFFAKYPSLGGGSGTVTSVGLSLPAEFIVTGSPVTTSGTLTGTWASESANLVFASPNGSSGTPSFRSLVAADIPLLPYLSTTLGTANGLSVTGGNTLNLGLSSTSTTGSLSSTDWNTFNNKQPAGNYITALTGDVTASGPGSVAATLANIPNKVYVDLISGNDSNTGTLVSPWKTLQHAYNSISPSINAPYVIYLSGGNNDTDSTTITAKPNVSIVADYVIQINHLLSISGGSTNDSATFVNINFVGGFSWVRNDATAIGVTFDNCQFFGSCTLEQNGSGSCSVTALNTVFVVNTWTLPNAFAFFFACSFLGASTFNDSGSNTYYEFIGGYSDSAMSISGGVNPVYFSAFVHDIVFGASLTFVTTGSGTPAVEIDSSGFPSSYTGSPTITFLSFSKYISYSPAVSANWNSVPDIVSSGLDTLATSGIVKSQSANLVFASPNGSSGLPSFRSLVSSDLPAGTGTVTSVSVVSANGLAGTVATSTTTPAITLSTTITGILKGNGTAISAAVSNTDYQAPISTFSAPTHQFVTGFTAPNTFTAAQPAFTDISGSVTSAQMLALATNDIYVGNGSNQPAAVAMSGDATIVSSGSLTLATVNSNVGSFTNANITVNGKGLITAASNGTLPKMSVVDGGNASYSIQAGDNLVRSGTTLTADRTYTLPLCGSGTVGETHYIKNLASQTYNIIVAPNGGGPDTIDGSTSSFTLTPGDSITLVCGSFSSVGNWDIL